MPEGPVDTSAEKQVILVRNTTESNKFDDYLLVIYKNQELEWVREMYPITTDPGKHWLL